MELRFIERDTKLEIEMLSSPNVQAVVGTEMFEGSFVDTEKSVNFLFSCDEIYDNLHEFALDQYWKFSFYRDEHRISFSGKIAGTTVQSGYNVITGVATSLLEKSARRKSPRIVVNIPVKIYDMTDEGKVLLDDVFCQGTISDVSRGGISCTTVSSFNFGKQGKQYTAEFYIDKYHFRIPISYVRSWARAHAFNEFSHAFTIPGGVDSEDAKRITLALFELRMVKKNPKQTS